MKRTTLEVMCEGAFGYKGEDDTAAENITCLLGISLHPLSMFPFGSNLLRFWYRHRLEFVDRLLNDIIAKRLNGSDKGKHDLLELIITVDEKALAKFNVPKHV